jgi:hypothetical protein
MELIEEQRKKIWLVSDTILYPEAVIFMRELVEHEEVKQLPKDAQMMGLLNIIKSSKYDDVLDYINHQIVRNVDKVFYEKLLLALTTMQRKRMQEEFQLVIPQSTKQAENAEKKELMLLLAREFIQHIIAENDMLQVGEKRSESNG